MLATFKETFRSIRDLDYGVKIVDKSGKEVFWYWYKYVLFFAAIMLFLALGGVAYFTPQLTKLAQDKLPQFDLTVKDGKASTHVPQPQTYTDSDLGVILNMAGKPSDLDPYKNGALISAEKIIVKTTDGPTVSTKEIKWSDFGDFTIDKPTVVSWLTINKMRVLGTLLGIVVVLGVVMLAMYTGWQMMGMAIWAVIFLLVAKVLKRSLEYTQVVRLVVYASVISLLVGVLNLLLPNQILSILSLGLFAFYVCAWIYRLK